MTRRLEERVAAVEGKSVELGAARGAAESDVLAMQTQLEQSHEEHAKQVFANSI